MPVPVLHRRSSFENASAPFRAHLPDVSSARFRTAAQQDVYEYAAFFRDNHAPPWLFSLTEAWTKLYGEPFKGISNDGIIRPELYDTCDQGVDSETIVNTTKKSLAALDEAQKISIRFPLNAREWRAWSNPEILLRPLGLRLEEVSQDIRQALLRIIEASLSPEGFQKALAAMRVNHFLGECVQLPRIMNQYSYNFLLFGEPSTSESSPWGWLLYGHHLCISCFFRGSQIVISPTFTGAEPNVIDAGIWEGTAILHTEGTLGLKLMQSLLPEQQQKAQVFKDLKDDGMEQTGDLVTDRWNKDDQRHVCGAFRDNRIVPYEGVSLSLFDRTQQQLVLDIANEMTLYLPQQARHERLKLIQSHFDETYFSWIGGFGDEDAFYYRVQSPVVILEFDHHSGVFLNNTEPAKFHIHTIARSPNGGDYGQALREKEQRLQ